MQTIFVNDNKIEFSCKTSLVGRDDMDSDCYCFLAISKNDKRVSAKGLTPYEKEKLEDRIEELINKGRVE